MDREPWEVLIDAAVEHRQLTREEIDNLYDDEIVKVAMRRGLIDEETGQRRLTDIYDDRRERSWYDD